MNYQTIMVSTFKYNGNTVAHNPYTPGIFTIVQDGIEEKEFTILKDVDNLERITNACVYRDGEFYNGFRHSDAIKLAIYEGCIPPIYGYEQGFMTTKGRFVSRIEAYEIWQKYSNVSKNEDRILYSEHIY